MVEFIPAESLKSQFNVFGHFYSVRVAPRTVIECRSVLELIEKSRTPAELSEVTRRTPDAVIIMMNPGSSEPLVEVGNQLRSHEIHQLAVSLVPTKPDTTQYQVMRVMRCCGWRHVRVLNLSDLRCAQSATFFKQFKQLEQDHSFDAHSLFADRRARELAAKLPEGIPVIRAWGVSPSLEPLIERCLAKIKHVRQVGGLLKEGTENKYLHPLPSLQSQKIEWTNRMVEQCRAKFLRRRAQGGS
jgi:hypothetical protein